MTKKQIMLAIMLAATVSLVLALRWFTNTSAPVATILP